MRFGGVKRGGLSVELGKVSEEMVNLESNFVFLKWVKVDFVINGYLYKKL